MTIGQDERVFNAYILGTRICTRTHATYTGNKTWYVQQNKVGLHTKSNGPECHVSVFVGHINSLVLFARVRHHHRFEML